MGNRQGVKGDKQKNFYVMKHVFSFVFFCFCGSDLIFFLSTFIFRRFTFLARLLKRKSLSDCKIF